MYSSLDTTCQMGYPHAIKAFLTESTEVSPVGAGAVWSGVGELVSARMGTFCPRHFKEETISLCHPERSEGSVSDERSFASLRMTRLHRLHLTRTTSSLKCLGPCVRPSYPLNYAQGHQPLRG